MSQYFPKPYEHFRRDINVKVDLSNYATKADLENVKGTNICKLALKPNLKAEIDQIDVGKLKTVPIDLSKLSNVVNNDAA